MIIPNYLGQLQDDIQAKDWLYVSALSK